MIPTKIVILGGSGVATPALVTALAEIPQRIRPIELVLVGRSAEKLANVVGVARLLAAGDPLMSVRGETDAALALEGAEIVLNQVRVGGLEARAFDESFPRALGLPGEETVGPGGFANATRTIPVAVEYARLVEQVCPQATLLTFANPSSMVQYAITRSVKVTTIGLCDAPVGLRGRIAAAAGADPAQVSIDYAGMHHFGWVSGAREDGRDIFPRVLENAHIAAPEVDPQITHAFGAVPGAYFNYLFHPDRMLAKQQGRPTRAEELLELQDELLAEFAAAGQTGQKPAGLARRRAGWYAAIIAPVMVALAERREATFIANLANGSTIPWLPAEAIVEVPVLFQQGRARALPAPQLPAAARALVQANCAYEMEAVQAILSRDRAAALRALLLNPMIRTYEQARRTLELAWKEVPDGPG